MKLDSKPTKIRFEDYAYLETRYKMLTKSNPEEAKRLMVLAEEDVKARWKWFEEESKESGAGAPKAGTN